MDMHQEMDLQLFADAGTLVNAGGNYVNAYTGEKTAFPEGGGMTASMKTFYDTELLENARPELIHTQFARKQVLPAGRGKTVEWRKWNTLEDAGALTEGVIPTGQKFGMSVKTASIDQYGTFAAVSDQLELHAYDDVILGATEEMGASLAETQEVLIRDALLTNTNVLYCDNVTEDGTFVSTPTSCATMAAGGTTGSSDSATPNGWAKLTPDMVAKAVTKMKKDRVPMIHGKYAMVIHPSVAYDLRKSKDWVEAHKYAATTELFNGEIGELHGMRFIEDVFAPVLTGNNYKNKANGATYACYAFGKDSFGIIDPDGGGAEMIVHDKSEIGGPLNQFSTIGYKFETNGATMLYPERMLRVMAVSSYSATDTAN